MHSSTQRALGTTLPTHPPDHPSAHLPTHRFTNNNPPWCRGAIQTGVERDTLAGVGAARPAPPGEGPPGGGGGAWQQQQEQQRGGARGEGGAGLTAEEIREAKRLAKQEERRAAKRAKKEAKKVRSGLCTLSLRGALHSQDWGCFVVCARLSVIRQSGLRCMWVAGQG